MGEVKERYSEDKPKDCAYCYFWKRRGGCRLKVCYYLEKVKEADGESCNDCPYGRFYPCIGYCLREIIRETKVWQ